METTRTDRFKTVILLIAASGLIARDLSSTSPADPTQRT